MAFWKDAIYGLCCVDGKKILTCIAQPKRCLDSEVLQKGLSEGENKGHFQLEVNEANSPVHQAALFSPKELEMPGGTDVCLLACLLYNGNMKSYLENLLQLSQQMSPFFLTRCIHDNFYSSFLVWMAGTITRLKRIICLQSVFLMFLQCLPNEDI